MFELYCSTLVSLCSRGIRKMHKLKWQPTGDTLEGYSPPAQAFFPLATWELFLAKAKGCVDEYVKGLQEKHWAATTVFDEVSFTYKDKAGDYVKLNHDSYMAFRSGDTADSTVLAQISLTLSKSGRRKYLNQLARTNARLHDRISAQQKEKSAELRKELELSLTQYLKNTTGEVTSTAN